MANAYLKAVLLTAALTLLAFFFIGQLDSMRASELRRGVSDLMVESESERLLYLYAQVLGNSSQTLCEYASSAAKARADRTYGLSEKIRYFEESNVVNTEYQEIKNQYYISNAGLYLNIQATKKYCGSSPYKAVLFFYKTKHDCPACRAQGGVLDGIVKKDKSVRVFAFPIDTDFEFINVLARNHQISDAPALVIDEKTVFVGLQDQQTLESALAKG